MSELSPKGGSEGYGACDDEAAFRPFLAGQKWAPVPPSFVPRKINGDAAAMYGGPTYKNRPVPWLLLWGSCRAARRD